MLREQEAEKRRRIESTEVTDEAILSRLNEINRSTEIVVERIKHMLTLPPFKWYQYPVKTGAAELKRKYKLNMSVKVISIKGKPPDHYMPKTPMIPNDSPLAYLNNTGKV